MSMKNDLSHPTKKDVIWSYFGIIFAMGSNFFLLPFLLHYLDSNHIGLWFVFTSIGSFVSLLNFGFDPTMSRNFAYAWSGAESIESEGVGKRRYKEPNIQLLNSVYLVSKRIYSSIALLALFLLLTFGTLYIIKIGNLIWNNNVMIAWLVYCLAIFVNLFYGFYTIFLRGIGEVEYYNKANVYARIIQIIIAIILLMNGTNLIAVSTAYLAYGFIFRFLCKRQLLSNNIVTNAIFLKEKNITDFKKIFLKIWHNTWREGLVSISGFIVSQANTLICSTFFSLTITGMFSLTMQIMMAIGMFSWSYYNACQPLMQMAYAKNDLKASIKMLSLSIVNYDILFSCCTLFSYFLIPPLLNFFNKGIIINTHLFIVIAIYIFLLNRQGLFSSYISNTNSIPYAKSYCLSGILGVCLSIVLIKYFNFGIEGIIYGAMIVQALYNNWVWMLRVHFLLKVKFTEFYFIGLEQFRDFVCHNIRKILF